MRRIPTLAVVPVAFFVALLFSATLAIAAQAVPQPPPPTVFTPPPGGAPPGMPPGGPTPGSTARPGLPPRDRTATPTGTARVRGRVTSAETGAPLRRAQVAVMAQDVGVRRVTTTDGEGRYEFAELSAGRFTVMVTKAGFVSLQYGQRRPNEPGTPVVVADGATVQGIDMALPRGSVISGRLTDEFGEPIAGAQVRAQRYQYQQDGQRRLLPMGFANSDDLGTFRLYGLTAGEYVVSASVQAPMNIAAGGAPATDSNEGFAPTFYPGTANANEAQAVSLALGQETGVQFSLIATRLSRISGTVADSSGRPVSGAMVMLRSTSGASMTMFGVGQTMADGTFSLSGVTPGEHAIDVRPNARPEGEIEYGTVTLTVGGSDIVGVRIVTGKGTTVSGRVVFEGQATRTGGVAPTRVLLQPVDPMRMMMPTVAGDPLANGTVGEDGRFQMAGAPGPVFVRMVAPPGWALKSVTLDGADLTDTPYELTNESVSDVRVVLTDRITDVSGQVTDSRGQPAKDYMVVLQPADLKEGASPARFLRTVRPDQDGRFRVRGLPPGRYWATAVESIEQGRHFVPDAQDRLRASGRSFSVDEGGSASLDLRLTAGEF